LGRRLNRQLAPSVSAKSDHALDATAEGAGVLLAHDMLAYDELRTGRLVMPFQLSLRSGRAYHFVCPRKRQDRPNVQAFRTWLKQEVTALDWNKCVRQPRRKSIG
jgi:LysR family glycine cleavage system transcriptional activator